MGDPKKLRKKYATPAHPWRRTAIEEEKILLNDFGLTKKIEILVAQSFLKKYKNIAKVLIATKTAQAEKEKGQVLQKLQNLGLLQAGSELDQILALNVRDVLNRRIQSVLFRKGLARTIKQARQFIVHRHVMIGDQEITSPTYLVSLEEEGKVMFKPRSALAAEDHPERVVASLSESEKKEEKGKKKEKEEEEVDIVEVEETEE